MDEFPAEMPGYAGKRPAHVVACVKRSPCIIQMERDLNTDAVIAVQTDARVRLSCELVLAAAADWFRINAILLTVAMSGRASYLIRFPDAGSRQRALSPPQSFQAGGVNLRLLPWTRLANARTATVPYRVRVCIEGIPGHAWDLDTARAFFPQSTFVEEIDNVKLSAKEQACLCAWVWIAEPSLIPKQGSLQIEEPLQMEGQFTHYPELTDSPPRRAGPAEMLQYEVLVHIHEIWDYAFEPNSYGTGDVDFSSLESEPWPRKIPFAWHLGVIDGEGARRRTVLGRLGPRRRENNEDDDEGDFRDHSLGVHRFPRAAPGLQGSFGMRHDTGANCGASSSRHGRHGGRNRSAGDAIEDQEFALMTKTPQMLLPRAHWEDPMLEESLGSRPLLIAATTTEDADVSATVVQLPAVPIQETGAVDLEAVPSQPVEEVTLLGTQDQPEAMADLCTQDLLVPAQPPVLSTPVINKKTKARKRRRRASYYQSSRVQGSLPNQRLILP
jgi:hypothetical protein